MVLAFMNRFLDPLKTIYWIELLIALSKEVTLQVLKKNP